MKIFAPECPYCLANKRRVYMAAVTQREVKALRFYTAIGQLILKCGDCGFEEVWPDNAGQQR